MFKNLILGITIALFVSCSNETSTHTTIVETSEELEKTIESAKPGDEIILKNGIWKNLEIVFKGSGTQKKPITLKAETAGKVFLEGLSNLKIGGEYLIVEGLTFQNGHTPTTTVIDFKIDKNTIANHCKVTNCVIKDYNQLKRTTGDQWVEFWGRHNELSNCYLAGKFNQGPTIIVGLSGNEHIKNYHQIINNHFGPKPRKGGPKAETIRIGNSFTSMAPSHVNVAGNLFEKCNGEVEIISSKSNFNEFKNNVFYECEGSLVVRHGNYCKIDGNFFIGNDKPFVGGIRVINTGHTITNNYFYKVIGEEFRSPLAIMNGIPKSPLNRYNQVTDAVIAHNTWIDCKSPWQFSVGANMNKKDILPKQEIRSARPIRTLLANNIIYNHKGDPNPIVTYDKVDGIIFKNNLIDNQGLKFNNYKGIKTTDLEMTKISKSLFVPTKNAELETIFHGFEFEKITEDIFGNKRKSSNSLGAISNEVPQGKLIVNKENYGPSWYKSEISSLTPNEIHVASTDALLTAINGAVNGTVLVLDSKKFNINESIKISKSITLKSDKETTIAYNGATNTPLFEMNPKANLVIDGLTLIGNKNSSAFAANEKDLSGGFNLTVNNSNISKFNYIIKSCKGAFSDEINFTNTTLADCSNGLNLAAETDDKGDYNAEYLTIDSCNFKNIQKNVVNFYRGGYDESTIGGIFTLSNSSFTNCGTAEASGILLKTRGITNVQVSKNNFKNNSVKLIALLWGEKNNTHNDNTIHNSGKIRTEKYLKQKLVY